MQDNSIKIIALVVILLSISACGETNVAEIATSVQPTQSVVFPTPIPKATPTVLPAPVTFTPTIVPSPSPTIAPATATAPASFSMGNTEATLTAPPTPTKSTLPLDVIRAVEGYFRELTGDVVYDISINDMGEEFILPADVQAKIDASLTLAQTHYVADTEYGTIEVGLGATDADSIAIIILPWDAEMPNNADDALSLLKSQFPVNAAANYQSQPAQGLTTNAGKLLLPTPKAGLPLVGNSAEAKSFIFAAAMGEGGVHSVWMGIATTADGENIIFAIDSKNSMLLVPQ